MTHSDSSLRGGSTSLLRVDVGMDVGHSSGQRHRRTHLPVEFPHYQKETHTVLPDLANKMQDTSSI